MTATSAGNSSCLAAKGLDISLAALQRQDPYINNIMDVASQVALYTYNNRVNEWEKTEVEGTLFIYTRLASPRHGFTIMNRLSMENLTEPITKDLDFQLQDPFLLYRNARLVIHGIWFYDKEDCRRIAQRMKFLTQQEQVLAQSQGGWLSPGGGGRGCEGKTVDIIQMLTKARSEYDKEKSTSEPREFGGSSVLYGNPNLIKPIPVKPNTQESEGPEPKSLSLATLFGSQHKHHSSKPDPVSPSATHGMVPSTGKVTRPPVARTLTYDDTLSSGRSEHSKEVNVTTSGCSDTGVQPVFGGQKVREDSGVAVGVLTSPTAQQQNQSQHCPAIQKLMQGQRGVGGVLQTVSESPENRLCDNGVSLEHHHHHHHLFHQQQHQHHHHQQQQVQSDPIKRLFQTQSAPPSSAAPPCCSVPPDLKPTPLLHAQPVMVDSVSCPHSHQNQLLMFNQHQPETQHSQFALAALGTGMPPPQVTSGQCLQSSQGVSTQMPGVVSPHELLQKLQLVQQEQSLASHDSSQLCPGLAPCFLAATQSDGASTCLGPNQTTATAGQKAALQFQVISPQRIPATIAPTLLLSPSVFTQTKSSPVLSSVASDTSHVPSNLPRAPLKDEVRVLSRNQLQATLLHLIQTDSSFLDTIYEAYISRFVNDSCSKY